MNLAELQNELRAIGNKVNELETAVAQMKPKTEDEKAGAYKAITNLAIRYPLTRRGLDEAGENTRNMYIKVLAGMAFSEEDFQEERLLYIARIAAGITGESFSLEQIVAQGNRLDEEDMENMCADIEPVRDCFLLDALTVANICGKASEKMLSILAEFVMVFDCSYEVMKVLAAVSKGILMEDFNVLDAIGCEIAQKWSGKFWGIIPEQWLVKSRVFCGRYCKDNGVYDERFRFKIGTSNCIVKAKSDTGTAVHKGETLLLCEEIKCTGIFNETLEHKKRTISSPKDGIVYFIEDEIKNKDTDRAEKFVMVYVVSGFDSYEDFCRWYRSPEQAKFIADKERRQQGGNITDE